MEEMKMAYKILVGKLMGRDNSEDIGEDGENSRIELGEIGWKGME
jgi:hypothetical protein